MTAREAILELKNRMSQTIIGQEKVVERLIIVMLSDGNLLLEGLPGLAKTRAIKGMAKYLEVGLSRIQFTPDLLPSDVTGTEIYHSANGKSEFRFQPGPIFNNLILADEINRAPAKVQAALLEAMEERQVTVGGKTYQMSAPFMVMATQNPIEQEGTYPLPEAQMDRFLMHVIIGYPSTESEVEILQLVRGEEGEKQNKDEEKGKEKKENLRISPDHVFQARKEIHQIHISENIEKYIISLIDATRFPKKFSDQLDIWLDYGASPRGTIALDRCSRAHAWLNGRDFVNPDDVRAIIHDVLRHRIIPSYEATAEGITPDRVIDELVKLVAVA
jgi:MoxR-like ATPase